MDAIVLVGGFGTRLRPLTLTVPKNLVPVAGVPLIERVVARLAAHGVERVVLSLGYRPDSFFAAVPDDVAAGVPLTYVVEPEPLDTGGVIRFAARHAGLRDTFVVANGDVLTDLDITALIDAHRHTGAEGTVALTPVDDPSRFGVVTTDADAAGSPTSSRSRRPARRPRTSSTAGTYVFEHSMLAAPEATRGCRSNVRSSRHGAEGGWALGGGAGQPGGRRRPPVRRRAAVRGHPRRGRLRRAHHRRARGGGGRRRQGDRAVDPRRGRGDRPGTSLDAARLPSGPG